MATYTVENDLIGVYACTLKAKTEDTVTFADSVPSVEVLSDGTAKVYFTTDGTKATVGGANCFELPAVPAARVVTVTQTTPRTPTVVKLISEGAPVYSVSRAGE